ncbi:MAG: general secretion pathway protein GspE [Candidatus Parcubacteria bacterium]|nr:MAG: general secretion pathway protein GspE [Candidatus Parcubacteria bacterium]
MDVLHLLAARGFIREEEVPLIMAEADARGEPVESILERRGIAKDTILQLKEEQYNIPRKELPQDISIPYEVLRYIPEESALHYRIVPLGVVDGVLEIGVVDPDNIEAMNAINFIATRAKLPYKTYLISEEDFQKVLELYRGLPGTVGEALSELESEIAATPQAKSQEAQKGKESASFIKEDAPVTKIVATLIQDAVEGGASDIHIEHTGEKVRVRFRVDGVLRTSIVLPANVHPAMVARIKVLASLRLDEKRKPQDGRFSATINKRKIDFRVSTFPTVYGEKVVMRILDRESASVSLEKLGMLGDHLQMVLRAVRLPYGMVLITGPTGSGKSTTLQAMLWQVDRETKNVVSLEDPVEYRIEGVSQSQVRPEIGYTFANGLRSILRQDPDIIMVGEIRDKETAQLAVQAALTGHLVFSTLHTNTALGAIPRLIDMGVDPYLIAPTLRLLIGQRLVRRICEGSGEEVPVEGALKAMFEKQFADLPPQFRKEIPWSDTILRIKPTDECPSGTRGRIGVYEMVEVGKEMEEHILKQADEQALYALARQHGFRTMKEDAIFKAFQHIVPFEEINTLEASLEGAQEVNA